MAHRNCGDEWGCHRVLEPKGVLPQAAQKLDATLPPFDNEIVVEVEALQIDSASFRQLLSMGRTEVAGNILKIVQVRGKMENPVTGSGGVFLGTVSAIGNNHPARDRFRIGDKVVSLVSLSLTPLHLEKVMSVDEKRERVAVSGHAILFASGLLEKRPDEIPEGIFLAALDVCGAPAQVARLLRVGNSVLIIGLGKAGRSMAVQASDRGAKVYGVDQSEEAVSWCVKNVSGTFARLAAGDPLQLYHWVRDVTEGGLVDLSVQATNADRLEMSAILPVKNGGTVLFFGMATSFQRAALGAEGIGKDVKLLMGNGYVPGHAGLMLDLLKRHRPLWNWFEEKFA